MEKNRLVEAEVKVDQGFITIVENGKSCRFNLRELSERLADTTDEHLKLHTVSPSGYGIHWNLSNEDISIPALMNEPVVHYKRKEDE